MQKVCICLEVFPGPRVNQLEFLFLESVTRFNLSIDESTCESSVQNSFQWATYLTIQLSVFNRYDWRREEDATFQFNAMWLSGLMSTVALTLGQVKVRFQDDCHHNKLLILLQANKLLTEYQTTPLQQVVYAIACLGKQYSHTFFVCMLPVAGLGGPL